MGASWYVTAAASAGGPSAVAPSGAAAPRAASGGARASPARRDDEPHAAASRNQANRDDIGRAGLARIMCRVPPRRQWQRHGAIATAAPYFNDLAGRSRD